MKITFSAKLATAPDTLVVGAFEGRKLSHDAAEIDRRTKGALKKAMSAGRFTGAMEQFVDIVAPIGVAARRIVIAGRDSPSICRRIGYIPGTFHRTWRATAVTPLVEKKRIP